MVTAFDAELQKVLPVKNVVEWQCLRGRIEDFSREGTWIVCQVFGAELGNALPDSNSPLWLSDES